MFDFLKKKVSVFAEKIKQTIEKKQGQTVQQEPAAQAPKQTILEQQPPIAKQAKQQEHEGQPAKTQPNAKTGELKTTRADEPAKKEIPAAIHKEKPQHKIQIVQDDKRELAAKVGITKKLKGLFTGTITVSKQDIKHFLEEFELALLEADVEAGTAREITEKIGKDLEGKQVPTGTDVSGFLKDEIKKVLLQIMQTKKIDFLKETEKKKPFVVLFLGPNGAGKTTTIAKIANYLKENGKTTVLAAADTFRAASIEQLETHASAIGVKVIKQKYGADPAAVAFDAVAYAKAKNLDTVLIDSAGRQETNKNLLKELKKIERIAKPDLKIFIGESYAGQALLSQGSEFDKELDLDGFILTKMDVDSKGGTAISLLHVLKKPIIFAGTGQSYDDLAEFDPKFIVDRII